VADFGIILKAISKDDTNEDRLERIKDRIDPEGVQWNRPESSDDELLMVLIKLKTNFPATTIAYLFGHETEVAIDVLQSWIPFLAYWMQPFITWPSDKADFIKLIPSAIKKDFENRALAVLDVVEVKVAFDDFTEESSSAKFLVAYNWNGAIVYRSRLFDGQRTSDKAVINSCGQDLGFLDTSGDDRRLKKSEVYLVNRRSCLANEYCCLPEKPKSHFSAHVGRVVSKLSQFAILSDGAFPAGLIPCLDEIITLCCGLVNLSSTDGLFDKDSRKTKW